MAECQGCYPFLLVLLQDPHAGVRWIPRSRIWACAETTNPSPRQCWPTADLSLSLAAAGGSAFSDGICRTNRMKNPLKRRFGAVDPPSGSQHSGPPPCFSPAHSNDTSQVPSTSSTPHGPPDSSLGPDGPNRTTETNAEDGIVDSQSPNHGPTGENLIGRFFHGLIG